MPTITRRLRVFWMPQDELATIDCRDLTEPRWYGLIETLLVSFAPPGTALSETLKFYAHTDGLKSLLVAPAWVAEAIVEHLNGRVADLSLGEYLGFLCTERAARVGALGSAP